MCEALVDVRSACMLIPAVLGAVTGKAPNDTGYAAEELDQMFRRTRSKKIQSRAGHIDRERNKEAEETREQQEQEPQTCRAMMRRRQEGLQVSVLGWMMMLLNLSPAAEDMPRECGASTIAQLSCADFGLPFRLLPQPCLHQ